MNPLSDHLKTALGEKYILESTATNASQVYSSPETTEGEKKSIEQLVEAAAWEELNDRFYKSLAFGTGGIRGRTIGKIVTAQEKGTPSPLGAPQYPAVGTNMMNSTNIRRAAMGLGEYILQAFPGKVCRVVIAHDTRHFSADFTKLCAEALQAQGIDVFIFSGERSTPQLSFSVRWLQAQAGIVISASHNPPHDNGFKAYFADGGQLVEPHASGVIAKVNALAAGAKPTVATTPGKLTVLGEEADQTFTEAVRTLVLEPTVILKCKGSLKIVYTSLHGTGIKIIPRLFDAVGLQYSVVAAQRVGDGRFPTVKSPNPEESAALALAIEQAKTEGADLVIATDPDCDRMGAAIRNGVGQFEVITGNMIGSIIAYYRTERLFAQGKLNEENKGKAAIIKTFVTTDLQKAIAQAYGVKCVECLTGFKYIGEKLRIYETDGTFFIFGGEESYGYSGGNYVRDKDGNAAALMLAEVAAWAKSHGQTLLEYLDAIYRKFGFFAERLGTLTFEGAAGAAQIKQLLASYRATPPKTFQGQAVTQIQDFGQQTYRDVDGKEIPKETMLIFHLADGGRMAVRGSGTEPKIKFYFFTQAAAGADLSATKQQRRAFLDAWWEEVQGDVKKRVS
jgi:phosphoglucomutase